MDIVVFYTRDLDAPDFRLDLDELLFYLRETFGIRAHSHAFGTWGG